MTVAAVRGPLLVFMLPARVLGPIARDRDVRAVLSFLLRPRVAFGLWAANLAVWHIPSLYIDALLHPWLHDLEHACWMLAGLLVWTLLIDPGSHHRLSVGGRIALAAAMFGAGQVLTSVLVFSFHPLYPIYRGAYGFSALTDQKLAGVVMMVEQLLVLGTFAYLAAAAARAARAPRARVSATSFSFEPAFLVLAVAAAAAYVWAARTDPPADAGAQWCSGSGSSSSPRRSTRRSRRSPRSGCCSSICCRTR